MKKDGSYKLMKTKVIYVCQNCGAQFPQWMGRCPDCQQWNTLVEENPASHQTAHKDLVGLVTERGKPVTIKEVTQEMTERVTTGNKEMDQVMGGGIVTGSVTLVGGDPGIGKSTLMLQMLHGLANPDSRVLYVSGEESIQQIKLRAERLCIDNDNLFLFSENSLEAILSEVKTLQPRILVVDSIQTVFTESLPSVAGTIGQVRETSGKLIYVSKMKGISTFLVGHVTKEGAIAGPRVLEHMVDTVLYFEGDKGQSYRILRAVKNRFGPANEIGVFEMKEQGLVEVGNPSHFFLAGRPKDVSGSVVVASLEGTRPILVELQALVSPSSYGVPQRTAIGVDRNRLSLLVAVLEKKMDVKLFNQDIFVNVAGGVRVEETAVDLGVVMAILSSYLDRPLDPNMLVLGEVGLGGEVRAIGQVGFRVKEGEKLGFTHCLLPESNIAGLKNETGISLMGVSSIAEAFQQVLEANGRKRE